MVFHNQYWWVSYLQLFIERKYCFQMECAVASVTSLIPSSLTITFHIVAIHMTKWILFGAQDKQHTSQEAEEEPFLSREPWGFDFPILGTGLTGCYTARTLWTISRIALLLVPGFLGSSRASHQTGNGKSSHLISCQRSHGDLCGPGCCTYSMKWK